MVALALAPLPGRAQSLDTPLTGTPGDPTRGRAIVSSRQASLCVLCHPGPFADTYLQGTLAPDLAGVGDRLSAGEIRLRLVDPQAVAPGSIMPSYRRASGFVRPGRAFLGKPILPDQAIEDVVAYLVTLKAP